MRGIERLHSPALAAVLTLLLAGTLTAQAGQTRRRDPTFRFTPEAGLALRALWDSSVAAHAERVACLGAEVRNDSVVVRRILPLAAVGADSMSVGSEETIERCGPPEWSGTVHSHVAEYSDGLPSTTFSAQDRRVMRRWYERWRADGVFCVVYSRRDAHCEADGVVGGIRSRPRETK